MATYLSCVIAIIATASCSVIKPVDSSVSSLTTELISSPETEPNIFKDACDFNNDHCDNLWSPSLCILRSYSNQELGHEHGLFSFGNNPCLATKGLRKKFCESRWEEPKAGQAICIPDPSETECQNIEALLVGCQAEGPESQLYCYATSYGGKQLTMEKRIPGWGVGRCHALGDLYERACRLQLRPSRLDNIICQVSNIANQCPATWELCTESRDPRTCTLETTEISGPLVASGVNLCHAHNWLRYKLCLSDIRPTLAVNARCERNQ